MEYFKSLSFWQIYFYSENCCVIQEERKKTPKPQNLALWGYIVAFVVDLHQVYFVNSIQLEFKEFATWEQK